MLSLCLDVGERRHRELDGEQPPAERDAVQAAEGVPPALLPRPAGRAEKMICAEYFSATVLLADLKLKRLMLELALISLRFTCYIPSSQVCYYLMVGQVKSVKTVLKQLQQSIQTITTPTWPADDDLSSASQQDHFIWMPREHLCVLVYLVTVMHSMQVQRGGWRVWVFPRAGMDF